MICVVDVGTIHHFESNPRWMWAFAVTASSEGVSSVGRLVVTDTRDWLTEQGSGGKHFVFLHKSPKHGL